LPSVGGLLNRSLAEKLQPFPESGGTGYEQIQYLAKKFLKHSLPTKRKNILTTFSMAITVWFLSGRRKLFSIDHSIFIGLKSGECLLLLSFL
jgi:hypothetical protein